MCLDLITTHKPTKTSGVGYQVFKVNEHSHLQSRFRHDKNGYKRVSCKIGVWQTDRNSYQISCDSSSYLTGFHIFVNKSEAEFFRCSFGSLGTVRKVQYRDAVVIGRQQDLKVVVARMRRIVPIREENESK